MEIWMIALCIVGAIIFLTLLALIIYKLCKRRKKKSLVKTAAKVQNGHVWQAHGQDVELGHEDDSQGHLKEDGLCKETAEASSTFPRKAKAEKPKKEDGLCEDTMKRFSYPRRGRIENQSLLPIEKNNLSASESALKSAVPVGVSVITSFGSKEKNVNEETNVEVHKVNQQRQGSGKKDKESSSNSSSDSDSNGEYRNGTQHLIKSSSKKVRKHKHSRTFNERKRAKSFVNYQEDLPEYTKPIKRSVSNPSIDAREQMLQKDKRFDNLETWKSTVPLPQPDYQNPPMLPSRTDDEDQDNAPPSYATSDSGVECLDALSGRDDDSVNQYDSVPESPKIPLSQMTRTDGESSFSTYQEYSIRETSEIRHTNDHDVNGFQGNIVSMTTKDHTALIDANIEGSPSTAANQQQIFFQNTPETKTTIVDVSYNDPQLALREKSDSKRIAQVPNTLSNSKMTTDRIQKTEQMDFRSVKLRPTSKNYDQDISFQIIDQRKENIDVMAPSYGNDSRNAKVDPISLAQQHGHSQSETVSSSQGQTVITVTDGAKEHYFLDGSKKQIINKETIVSQRNNPETEERIDFLGFKLRKTPQSIKEHIAFREEMEPHHSIQTKKHDENGTNNTTKEGQESTVGVLDGIRRFQTENKAGTQVPKPLFGSHYISKKDPNLKPVHIVPPEPATNEREIPNTRNSTSSLETRNVERGVKVNQKETVTTIETKRPVSLHQSAVTPEDKRNFRYSTGNFNQINNIFQSSNSLQKKVGEPENQINIISTKELTEKPIAVVPPQSPKVKRENPEDRAALEEERKKNWKREQIEQKLTTANLRSQNDPLIQASGLAYKLCMPELFNKIKQIGEEKE